MRILLIDDTARKLGARGLAGLRAGFEVLDESGFVH